MLMQQKLIKKIFLTHYKSTTRIYSETQIDLLSLGWRKNSRIIPLEFPKK
jgi:hypothetical protein